MPDFDKPPLAPVQGDTVPFAPYWHIRQVEGPQGIRYEVRDSRGEVVAADIKTIEHARLFALAPQMHTHFHYLANEAQRTLHFMVDVQEGLLDIHEVAEDVDGKWERGCNGAPGFAEWLIDVRELQASIGDQYPAKGVARQKELDLGAGE